MSTASHPAARDLPASTHALCTCDQSGNSPFSDGSHTRLSSAGPSAAATPAQHPWWKFWA